MSAKDLSPVKKTSLRTNKLLTIGLSFKLKVLFVVFFKLIWNSFRNFALNSNK
jgi:hypothetical protein